MCNKNSSAFENLGCAIGCEKRIYAKKCTYRGLNMEEEQHKEYLCPWLIAKAILMFWYLELELAKNTREQT